MRTPPPHPGEPGADRRATLRALRTRPPGVPPEARTAAEAWRADRADFWAHSLRGWDLAFYAMWAIGLVAYLTDPPDSGVGTAIAIAMFVVLLAAYLLIGRRAAVHADAGLGLVYLAVMFVCVTAVVSASETGTLLLFIAYSQVWYFSASRRIGIALTVLLTLLVFTAIALQSDIETLADAGALISQGGIAIAFSVLLGLWVTQVAEQSEDRAKLLTQLEAAQAEAAASHHSAGVLAERERMSREIHDTLAQGFTSVIMLAQTADADLRRQQPDRAAERLALIERTARENLAEARALVAATAPVGLAEATLIEALERLAARFGQETGVRVRVVADDDAVAHLPREREVVLLRAAQEALSNVRRHARARNVDLVLAADAADESGAARVRLDVVDDGAGMDPASAEGYGLRGMRDRVTAEGGRLAVSTGVGQGTHVRVTVPASAGSADDAPADAVPADAVPADGVPADGEPAGTDPEEAR